MPGSIPNFDLVTELQTCIRRDFPVAVAGILNPTNAANLSEGEWLELDANYNLARGAAGVGGTHEGNLPSFVVHTEKGRYDTQAIGKTSVIYLGMFEADTLICDVTGGTVGMALTIQDLNLYSYATRRGLKAKTGAAVLVVGYVSKLFAGNVNKCRFIHTGYALQA